MKKYLFVHFIGEQKDGEQIYFSLSADGMHWKDVNQGKPVLHSNIGEKGVRDPFLVRDEKNHKFYLIATDLRIEAGKGWEVAQYEASKDIIVWESQDLVHWSKERSCRLGVDGAGCVWAPESIYDKEKDAFLVFWASMIRLEQDTEPKHRIYAAYTKDFVEFSEPFIYIERENHVIDTTIIYDNDWYYRFSKDETMKSIQIDRSKSLTGEFEVIPSDTLTNITGVEGPEAYQLPDGKWCLIVDRFAAKKGYMPLITDNLEKGEFSVVDEKHFDFGQTMKRHGGILEITEEEYQRIVDTWGI